MNRGQSGTAIAGSVRSGRSAHSAGWCQQRSLPLASRCARIPARSLVLGVPGKVVRTLTAEDEAFHRALAGKYTRLAHNHRVG